MLTSAKALELAGRHQAPALRDAADHAAALGEPVGFLRRPVAGGAVFEAVAPDSARTCAGGGGRGALRLLSRARPAADFRRPVPVERFRASSRRAAERALIAAARPRGDEPA